MTRSLQLIPPTTVAVLRALEIILAYVAQVGEFNLFKPSCRLLYHCAFLMLPMWHLMSANLLEFLALNSTQM